MNYILLVFSIDPKDLEIMYFPICNFLCPTKLETCMRGKNKISAAFVVTYIDINPKFQYFSGFVSLIIQILRLLLKNYTINLCKSDMCILLTIALCIFFPIYNMSYKIHVHKFLCYTASCLLSIQWKYFILHPNDIVCYKNAI